MKRLLLFLLFILFVALSAVSIIFQSVEAEIFQAETVKGELEESGAYETTLSFASEQIQETTEGLTELNKYLTQQDILDAFNSVITPSLLHASGGTLCTRSPFGQLS